MGDFELNVLPLKKTLLLLVSVGAAVGIACGGPEAIGGSTVEPATAVKSLTATPEAPARVPEASPTPGAPEIAAQTGELEVRVTDAPPEGVSHIVVTVSEIQVHKVGPDEDSGWIPIIEEEMTFDLVELTGVEEVLGTKELAVGKYTQIRMDVVKVDVHAETQRGAGICDEGRDCLKW